jgi:hypothetical protein
LLLVYSSGCLIPEQVKKLTCIFLSTKKPSNLEGFLWGGHRESNPE